MLGVGASTPPPLSRMPNVTRSCCALFAVDCETLLQGAWIARGFLLPSSCDLVALSTVPPSDDYARNRDNLGLQFSSSDMALDGDNTLQQSFAVGEGGTYMLGSMANIGRGAIPSPCFRHCA